MEWFWLFIAISTVAVLSVIWYLGPKDDGGHGNSLSRVNRNLFWLFILFVLTPLLGIAVGLLTNAVTTP